MARRLSVRCASSCIYERFKPVIYVLRHYHQEPFFDNKFNNLIGPSEMLIMIIITT